MRLAASCKVACYNPSTLQRMLRSRIVILFCYFVPSAGVDKPLDHSVTNYNNFNNLLKPQNSCTSALHNMVQLDLKRELNLQYRSLVAKLLCTEFSGILNSNISISKILSMIKVCTISSGVNASTTCGTFYVSSPSEDSLEDFGHQVF